MVSTQATKFSESVELETKVLLLELSTSLLFAASLLLELSTSLLCAVSLLLELFASLAGAASLLLEFFASLAGAASLLLKHSASLLFAASLLLETSTEDELSVFVAIGEAQDVSSPQLAQKTPVMTSANFFQCL